MLVDGLNENRTLVELDVRETECGAENEQAIRLKLSGNRHLHVMPCDVTEEDDDQLDGEEQLEEEEDLEEADEDREDEPNAAV